MNATREQSEARVTATDPMPHHAWHPLGRGASFSGDEVGAVEWCSLHGCIQDCTGEIVIPGLQPTVVERQEEQRLCETDPRDTSIDHFRLSEVAG